MCCDLAAQIAPALRSSKVRSTSRRIAGEERNEYSSVSVRQTASAPPPAARGNAPSSGRRPPGRRPGRNRSTASCRRRRRSSARRRRAPCAGGELLRQKLDHAPLVRAGVLRLVHQDVVDAAVQPEQHPCATDGSVSSARALRDQVVEVEQPARRLARVHRSGRKAAAKRCSASGRSARAARRNAPGPRRLDPQHQRVQRGRPGRPARPACALVGNLPTLAAKAAPPPWRRSAARLPAPQASS